MISRRTTLTLGELYSESFTIPRTGSILKGKLHDYVYEREYQPFFCNLVQRLIYKSELKEFVLRLHTGETISAATPDSTWEERMEIGQRYLFSLAQDYLRWFTSDDIVPEIRNTQGGRVEELVRRLEMDGYIFDAGILRQSEAGILDVQEERGILREMHMSLNLPDPEGTFAFLKSSEDHYVAGRWSDAIIHARKFHELIMRQVAEILFEGVPQGEAKTPSLDHAADVRKHLEKMDLLEEKERKVFETIYGLLSHTGGHPYMAERDQARLLRQLALTITQFILLRLRGRLSTTPNESRSSAQ